jgi:hypothetical protein
MWKPEERLKTYRMRAKQTRAAADDTGDGADRITLLWIASDYDLMADNLEAKANQRRRQKLLRRFAGEGTHMNYHCFLLDLQSKVVSIEIISAQNDPEAVALAEAVFDEKRAACGGFEVWDRGRRVERVLTDGSEQIRRWRMKAEEIRTAVESVADNSARQAFLHSADTYDALANAAEMRRQHRATTG